MSKLKRKLILLLILLMAILSVLLTYNTIVEAVDPPTTFQVISRVGKYIDLGGHEIVASFGGNMVGGGPWTWDDVLSEEALLCCDEDGEIPGRTMANGKTLDFSFKPAEGVTVDGTGEPITYEEFQYKVDATKNYIQGGEEAISDMQLTGKLKEEDWFKVYTLETKVPAPNYEYINNSYAWYEVEGVMGCTPMEAYILAELGRTDSEIQIQIHFTASGEYYEEHDISWVHHETGMLVGPYGDEQGETEVYYTTSTTESLNEEEYEEQRGKAGEGGYSWDGTKWTKTTYSGGYIKDPRDGEGWVKVDVLRYGGNIQWAWWATVAGGGSGGYSEDLAGEAYLFEQYINSLEGEYEAQWIVDGDYKDVYVYNDLESEDGMSMVGPMALDYIEAHAQVGSRPYVQFAGITDFVVIMDNGEELKLGEGFKFEWMEERTKDVDFPFPFPEEGFYIKLLKDTDATKIKDIKVSFRHMHATGQYQKLGGIYFEMHFHTSDWSTLFKGLKQTIESHNNLMEGSPAEDVVGASGGFFSQEELETWLKTNGDMEYSGGKFSTYFEALNAHCVWSYGRNSSGFGEFQYYEYPTDSGEFYTISELQKKLIDAATSAISKESFKNEDGTYDEDAYDLALAKAKNNAIAESFNYAFDLWTIEGDGNQRIHLFLFFSHDEDIEMESQALCWAGAASKWYEFGELHRQIDYKTGTIAIRKDIEDEEGENINELDPNAVFEFQVSVWDCQNPYTTSVFVRPGQTVEAPIVYWDADGKAPSYSVEEIGVAPGYELKSIDNASGTIPDDGTRAVLVHAVNINKPDSTTIEIDKKIVEHNSDLAPYKDMPEEVKLEGKEFIFKVTINGTFKYGDTWHKNEEYSFEVPVTSNGETWKSEEIKWYGPNAPTYSVEELRVEGLKIKDIENEGAWIEAPNPTPGNAFTLVSLQNASGTLVKDIVSKVHAVNDYLIEKARLGIDKRAIATGNLEVITKLEKILENRKFVFDIQVDGYPDDIGRTLYPLRIDDENRTEEASEEVREYMLHYQWLYKSDPISWVYGNNPKFEITEVLGEDDTGIQFDVERTQNAEENDKIPGFKVEPNKVSGYLYQDADVEETLVDPLLFNKLEIPNPVKGKISVKKIAIDSNASEAKLHGETYPVIVLLTGKFKYQGNEYDTTANVDQKIQIVRDVENGGYKAVEVYGEEYSTDYILLTTPEGEPGKVESEPWESEDVEWYEVDGSPEYEVKEVIQGIPVTGYSINPESGDLIKEKTINVEITNIYRDTGIVKKGYIKIYKELENVELCTEEYINSLRFEFNINIKYDPSSGRAERNIPVVLDKDDYDPENHRWEMKRAEEIIWQDEESEPTYEITEDTTKLDSDVSFKEYENCTGIIEASIIEKTKVDENGNVQVDASGEPIIEVVDMNSIVEAIVRNEVGKHGNIEISLLEVGKGMTAEGLNDKEYKFEITIRGKFSYEGGEPESEKTIIATIKPNNKWQLGNIVWAGKDAPTYTIKEIKDPDESSILESSYMSSGTLTDGTTSTISISRSAVKEADFDNGPKYKFGSLEIEKTFDGDVFDYDKDFIFEITVSNFRDDVNGELKTETFTRTVKGKEKVQVGTFKWINGEDDPPTYSIKEINGNASVSPAEGSLTANTTIQVSAENPPPPPKSANIVVRKEVIANKYSAAPAASFDMTVIISGTFKYGGENGEYVEGSKTFNISLSGGGSESFGPVVWYGDNAPTVRVIEDTSAEPFASDSWWRYIDTSNNGASLADERTVELVVTNQWDPQGEYDLTIRLAGQVWADEDQDSESKNSSNSGFGKIDPGEHGVEGVEVYVKRADGSNAEILANLTNAPLEQPIITEGSGYWETPRIKMKKGDRYYVEFVYDGQTYKATDYLVSGSAGDYMSSKSSAYFDNSMALDIDREDVNSRLEKIKGGSPINANGETVGKAEGSMGEVNLHYTSKINDPYAGGTRIASRLQTTDAAGRPFEVFKAKAQTTELQYPFDDRIVLASVSSTAGGKVKYEYEATYPYCLHINLGLKVREEADLGATKFLKHAKVTLKDQDSPYEYDFNTLADFSGSYYERQLAKDEKELEYALGLYSTGYYYRAEMYQTNSEIYDAIVNSHTGIPDLKALKDTELEVELTYEIDVYNESKSYDAQVYSINDYAESSLGMPIKTKIDDVEVDATWTNKGTVIGSDLATYRKLNLDLSGKNISSGGKRTIEVTFKVNKKTIEGVQEAVIDGQKSNIVEIESYSTYDDEGLAGKVDRDSAPDNINIREYNYIDMYEDDTDFAAPLLLKIIEDTKTVLGTVWEDSKENKKSNGDGQMDSDSEARIAGLTTEMVEIVEGYDKEGNKHEYEFLWPTSRPIASLGGKTIKDVTGFDSTTESATLAMIANQDSEAEVQLQAGDYKFEGIPSGKFIVKFLYGNNKMDLEDTIGISGPAYAAKADGTYFNDNNSIAIDGEEHRILVANYDNEVYKYTPAVYNGHDFKGTIYQGGKFAGSNITDKDFEFPGDERHYSDARDNELARLIQMTKTETMSNINTSLLNKANYDDANHNELYREYGMFADTAILNMRSDNEYFNEEKGIAIVVGSTGEDSGGVGLEIEERKHTIEKVDFGLIERPETALVVDKQITDIKIITNDGNVIFDADYDITYEKFTVPATSMLEDRREAIKALKQKTIVTCLGQDILGRDEYIVAEVKLKDSSINTDVLQALNKFENKLISITEEYSEGELGTGQANFRFVNMDDTILQGTTVKLAYQYTALNIGEEDYTSERIENIQDDVIKHNFDAGKLDKSVYREYKALIDEKLDIEKNRKPEDAISIGEYLGSFYYTGTTAGTDKLVSTRVRQIVDYVDNDIVFKQEDNLTENHLWRNASIAELKGNGDSNKMLVGDNVIPQFDLLDKNKIKYVTSTKNNIVLSSDDLYSTLNNIDDTGTSTLEQSNARFERKLIPFSKWESLSTDEQKEKSYFSTLELTVSKTVSSQDDQKTMAYDNLGEIVLLENAVGRRDMAVVLGNANPMKGEFEAAIAERDQSATELVTFTPPTGIWYEEILRKQSYMVIFVGLVIVTIGTVLIKRKVLKKKEQ